MSNEYDPFVTKKGVTPPTEILETMRSSMNAVRNGLLLGGEAIYFDPNEFVFLVLLASIGEDDENLIRVTKVVFTEPEIAEMHDFTDRVMDALRLFNKHITTPRVRWGFFLALANYLHHNAPVWAIVKEGLIAKAQLHNAVQAAQSNIQKPRAIQAVGENSEPVPVQIMYQRSDDPVQ